MSPGPVRRSQPKRLPGVLPQLLKKRHLSSVFLSLEQQVDSGAGVHPFSSLPPLPETPFFVIWGTEHFRAHFCLLHCCDFFILTPEHCLPFSRSARGTSQETAACDPGVPFPGQPPTHSRETRPEHRCQARVRLGGHHILSGYPIC